MVAAPTTSSCWHVRLLWAVREEGGTERKEEKVQAWLWEGTVFPRLHIRGGRALLVTLTSSLSFPPSTPPHASTSGLGPGAQGWLNLGSTCQSPQLPSHGDGDLQAQNSLQDPHGLADLPPRYPGHRCVEVCGAPGRAASGGSSFRGGVIPTLMQQTPGLR